MNKNEQNDTSRNTLLFRPATPTDIPELKELFEVADWTFCGNRPGRWEESNRFVDVHSFELLKEEFMKSETEV